MSMGSTKGSKPVPRELVCDFNTFATVPTCVARPAPNFSEIVQAFRKERAKLTAQCTRFRASAVPRMQASLQVAKQTWQRVTALVHDAAFAWKPQRCHFHSLIDRSRRLKEGFNTESMPPISIKQQSQHKLKAAALQVYKLLQSEVLLMGALPVLVPLLLAQLLKPYVWTAVARGKAAAPAAKKTTPKPRSGASAALAEANADAAAGAIAKAAAGAPHSQAVTTTKQSSIRRSSSTASSCTAGPSSNTDVQLTICISNPSSLPLHISCFLKLYKHVLLPANLHNNEPLLAALSRKDLTEVSHILTLADTSRSATGDVLQSTTAKPLAGRSSESAKAAAHKNLRAALAESLSAAPNNLAAVCEHLGNITASDLPCEAAVQQDTLAKVAAVALTLAWNFPADAPVLETRLQLLGVQVKSCSYSDVCYSVHNKVSARREVHGAVKRHLQPGDGVWPEEFDCVTVTVPALVAVAKLLVL